MEKQYYRIKDIASIKSGKRLPAGHLFSDEPTSHPYIRSRDIKNGRILSSNLAYLEEETFQFIKKYIIEEGDVAITIVANIGDIGYCDTDCDKFNLTENAVRLTKFNQKIVDSQYLAFYLGQPFMKQYMESLAAGAAQAKLGIYKIEKIKVPLPKIEYQRRIASILSAYDNLIENNNRRIRLLEQMAENLYKEWFVRFRFPGHEKVEMENGLPKGWKMVKMQDISVVTDGVHNTIHDIPQQKYYLLSCKNIKDGKLIIGNDERTIDEDTFQKLRKRTKLAKGDILMSSVGTIGETYLLNEEPSCFEFQRSVAIIKPDKKYVNSCYMYEMLKSMRAILVNASHGAAQQCLFIGDINRINVCLPPISICDAFDSKVQQIYDMILILTKQNQLLTRQRDLLLPRLMSGKLEVNA